MATMLTPHAIQGGAHFDRDTLSQLHFSLGALLFQISWLSQPTSTQTPTSRNHEQVTVPPSAVTHARGIEGYFEPVASAGWALVVASQPPSCRLAELATNLTFNDRPGHRHHTTIHKLLWLVRAQTSLHRQRYPQQMATRRPRPPSKALTLDSSPAPTSTARRSRPGACSRIMAATQHARITTACRGFSL